MEVLILARTRMNAGRVCIGGILVNTGRLVRLLDQHGYNQSEDSDYEVGKIWDIDFRSKPDCRSPHSEDILLSDATFTNKCIENISDFIRNNDNIHIWKGHIDNAFDSLIQWSDKGAGYINKEGGIPNHSVGFWINNRNLIKNEYYGIRYRFPNIDGGWRSIKYVGCSENTPERIPAGSIIRLSLARWWSPSDSSDEERCYLQMSGWYLNADIESGDHRFDKYNGDIDPSDFWL